MKRKLMTLLIGAILATASGMAAARDRISFGFFIGAPGFTYVAPPPVYYVPPPEVYYAPPPVVYYEPVPWGVRVHGEHHRRWHRHHRH